MENKSLKISFEVRANKEKAFENICKVTEWWTENLEGNSQKSGDEFTVRFGDVHVSTQRLTEIIPGRKVVWLVTESNLSFVSDKSEWTGTEIRFDIGEENGKTHVTFTHQGLIPQIECYNGCSGAWGEYMESLRDLIETGKGNPALKAG